MRSETRFDRGSALALTTVAAALLLGFVIAPLASASVSAGVSQANVSVVGDTGSDSITVSDVTDPACPGGSPCYEVDAGWEAVVAGATCIVKPPVPNSSIVLCPRAGITLIKVVGREGHDSLEVSEFVFGLAVRSALEGGPDEDTLTGSDWGDRLDGESGNDEINGRKGRDHLLGGPGADEMDGARGRDTLFGQLGPDRLIGGTGRDFLFGQGGADVLNGQQGRDSCGGGNGQDRSSGCEWRRQIP